MGGGERALPRISIGECQDKTLTRVTVISIGFTEKHRLEIMWSLMNFHASFTEAGEKVRLAQKTQFGSRSCSDGLNINHLFTFSHTVDYEETVVHFEIKIRVLKKF